MSITYQRPAGLFLCPNLPMAALPIQSFQAKVPPDAQNSITHRFLFAFINGRRSFFLCILTRCALSKPLLSHPTDLPIGLLRGLPAFSKERSQPDLASGTPEVCTHHREMSLCANIDSALRHCHGFMEKFIQLATDPDFQPFHWSWPG